MRSRITTSLTIALAFGAMTHAHSQTTIFSENFANGMPANFSMFDMDSLMTNVDVRRFSDAWITQDANFSGSFGTSPDTVAASTSWYSPAGASDDWMFTSGIPLPTNSVINLTWEALRADSTLDEKYEVRVLSAAPTVQNLALSTPVFADSSLSGSWETLSANLSAFAGDTVYIGFRNLSNDGYIMFVDDIKVVATACDLMIMPHQRDASCSTCHDGMAHAMLMGGTAPYTYAWNTGATTDSLGGIGVGQYDVTVLDANNCTASQTFTITAPVAVQTIADAHALRLMPNPTKGLVTIQLPANLNSEASISVFGIDGKLVWNEQINNPVAPQHTLMIQHLPQGLYTVQLRTADKIYTQRLEKQ